METSFCGLSIFWGGLAGIFLFLAVLCWVKYEEIKRLGGTLEIYKKGTEVGISIGGISIEGNKEEMLKKGERRHSVDVGGYFKFSSIINSVGFFLAFVGALLTALGL